MREKRLSPGGLGRSECDVVNAVSTECTPGERAEARRTGARQVEQDVRPLPVLRLGLLLDHQLTRLRWLDSLQARQK